jgi:oligoribonuclease NrnB/cAMP/cGMP phosphodiesterase (DHH superfamily)
MKKYVLYHKDCMDGFGSAFAAHLAMPEAHFRAVEYGKPLPEIDDESEVFILDFSYSRSELLDLEKRVSKLLVLDHHKTAQEALLGLKFAFFDIAKSGAVLSWEYFHPEKPIPKALYYIQDRDLWQWKLPYSREFSAGLQQLPRQFEEWSRAFNNFEDAEQIEDSFLVRTGQVILKHIEEAVSRVIKRAWLVKVPCNKGVEVVPCVSTTEYRSEVGEGLNKAYPDCPFSLSYHDAPTSRTWSIRSKNPLVDCSLIAQEYGGGGHKGAAGFQTGLRTYFPIVEVATK